MATTDQIEARWNKIVTDAVTNLRNTTGSVAMVDLRRVLDARTLNRDTQDQNLKRMSRTRLIDLAPESNRKTLTDADHAAAIRIGDDDCHIIALP